VAIATVTTQPSTAVTNGAALATQPDVHVTDNGGNPIAGLTVTATTSAGVVLANASAVTDAGGDASFTALTATGNTGSYTLHFAAGTASVNAAAPTVVAAGAPALVSF